MPAATELIMATLPPARAGVGSAVNDTVREVGGALGVAVIGSVAASTYASNLKGQVDQLPADVRAVVTDNIGAALAVSGHLGANGDRARRRRPRSVRQLDDRSSLWVGVALAALATVIAWTRLPKRAPAHGHAHQGHAAPPVHPHGHPSPHAPQRPSPPPRPP